MKKTIGNRIITAILTISMMVSACSFAFADSEGGGTKAGDRQNKAARTILLYVCGADLETDAAMATYNLEQILKSSFSADDDVKFLVMTGGSYKWHLDKDYLAVPDDHNIPNDAINKMAKEQFPGAYTIWEPDTEADVTKEISGAYNQLWEAKGADDPVYSVDDSVSGKGRHGKLVLLDGNGVTGKDGAAVKSEDELMSDSNTLKAFINYGVENYPAEKYDLILWDHGGGPQGGFGVDEHTNWMDSDVYGDFPSIMSSKDIVDALANNKVVDTDGDGTPDSHFDFVDFDACLMGNVDLALILADYTDYYIASPESEPGYGQYYGPEADADGNHYEGWLDVLGNDPAIDTFELGKVIVNDFYKFYEKEEGDGSGQDGTLAVIDTAKMVDPQTGFVKTLTDLSQALREQVADPNEDGVIPFYDEIISYYGSIEYSGYELFDLGNIAAFLGVVRTELSEKNIENGIYNTRNAYSDVSVSMNQLLHLQDTDPDNAFMYARCTSGIKSSEGPYRAYEDGEVYNDELPSSGLSIFFPNGFPIWSAKEYWANMDPIIEKMPNDDRKEFMLDYEKTIAYLTLIICSGKTIANRINSDYDPVEKSKITYELMMAEWTEDDWSLWSDIMGDCVEKIGFNDAQMEAWLRTLVTQQAADAIDGRDITAARINKKEGEGYRLTLNGVSKRIVDSVERNIIAETPVMKAWLDGLDEYDREGLSDNDLSLGSVKGTLYNYPDDPTLENLINWYNEPGGVWDIDELEQKWYGMTDAEGKLHVASVYLVDEDGIYVPALYGTPEDGTEKQRLIMMGFSNSESDGDHHVLTSITQMNNDAGPVEIEPKELKFDATLTPIVYASPMFSDDVFAPISSAFTLTAENADKFSLDYMDINDIDEIADIDGDGKKLDSIITVTDIYGYSVDATQCIKDIEDGEFQHIELARVKPAIANGTELVPEVVYMNETLKEGEDYTWEKVPIDTSGADFVYADFIEPGDYQINIFGKGRFTGSVIKAKFTIVLSEDAAETLVDQAKTELGLAQAEMEAALASGSLEDAGDAYVRLANAQNALSEAQELLERIRDVLSKEEQARLEDEIALLEKQVEDLNGQLAEAKVVDISNYAASIAKTSYQYSGKAIKPAVKVSGLTASDYTVKYTNNKNVGLAKVTITGNGDKYKGTITKTFKINPKPTKMKKPKAVKKGFKAKWNVQKAQTSGYQLQYALNSKFSKGKKTVTIAGATKSSKAIKKLKSKKVYYVRIRTYKTVNGKKYYSVWSTAVKVKTK